MHIDKQAARQAFEAYVSDYDPANPRIALKLAHTYRVASLCERIARAEGYDADVAWLIGLLHDIGRFEQVRRYGSFNDAATVSHARLGVDVLFGQEDPRGPQIRTFVDDPSTDDLIRTAIAVHSDYRVPEGLAPAVEKACHILRDADKVDIIKVNCICPIADIYGVSDEAMSASELTPAVVRTFYQKRTIPRGIRRHPADVLVGHICFAWELVFAESRAALVEQGYLDQMLSRSFDNPATQQTFAQMAAFMRRELNL